jgi:hypothetical protein
MANTLLTIDMITKEALRVLENNLTFTKGVNRQFDSSFRAVRRQDWRHGAHPEAAPLHGALRSRRCQPRT